jgi:hypothetical protein
MNSEFYFPLGLLLTACGVVALNYKPAIAGIVLVIGLGMASISKDCMGQNCSYWSDTPSGVTTKFLGIVGIAIALGLIGYFVLAGLHRYRINCETYLNDLDEYDEYFAELATVEKTSKSKGKLLKQMTYEELGVVGNSEWEHQMDEKWKKRGYMDKWRDLTPDQIRSELNKPVYRKEK